MDDAGGREDWEYQNEMLKENLKAMIDKCILLSVDFDPPVGDELTQEEHSVTIRLLPKETS